jgi:hypothetical protein
MTVTIQTSIRHNRSANGTFIYVRPAMDESRCGYALGYEYNQLPRLHGKVALYSSLDATCPVIVGYLSRIIAHWHDSVSVLITPSLQFYSKQFHPQPYHLRIPIQWIDLTPLQVVSRGIYLAFHPRYNIDLFDHHTPLYFSYHPISIAESDSKSLSRFKRLRLPHRALLSYR